MEANERGASHCPPLHDRPKLLLPLQALKNAAVDQMKSQDTTNVKPNINLTRPP